MILLFDRGVVSISGEDSRKFLQGLITNDIDRLTEEHAVYAAMLTPQGKYLFDFIISQQGNEILLDVIKERVPELVKKLSLYKLRSKVEIRDLSADYFVYSNHEEGVLDPRNPKLGKRFITKEKLNSDGSFEDYELLRISLGVPDSRDFIPDKTFIMQNSFEQLNGVDFNKGCYVGQEVTARTKYRGGIKKAIYVIANKDGLPPFGTEIKSGDKVIGEMRSSQSGVGLAQCDIEEMQKATELSCGGLKIAVRN